VLAVFLSAGGCGSSGTEGGGPDAQASLADAARSATDGRARDAALALADLAPAGSERRADAATPPPPPPAGLLGNLTLFVNLGDSLGAGYYATPGHSYRALLVKNDDALYPAYKGKDLQSRFPKLTVVDRAKSGATTSDVVLQAVGAPANPAGDTLVVISAGGNDFNDKLQTMIDPAKTAAAAQKATANLQKVAAGFADKTRYPGQVTILMLNVHDPTDETGNLPVLPGLSGFCTTIQQAGWLVGPTVVKNLASFNQALVSFAASQKLILADNHSRFLGHGFHHDDAKSPHYVASDPSLWFHTDCAHGNDRGHHELRRLIWNQLTGE